MSPTSSVFSTFFVSYRKNSAYYQTWYYKPESWMPLLTILLFNWLTVLKFLSVVHKKCIQTKHRKNASPSFLQVLDPYQEQNEESAVVVMEESDKKIKSAQHTVIDVPLPVANSLQTFTVQKIMFLLICGNRRNCISLSWVKWLLLC